MCPRGPHHGSPRPDGPCPSPGERRPAPRPPLMVSGAGQRDENCRQARARSHKTPGTVLCFRIAVLGSHLEETLRPPQLPRLPGDGDREGTREEGARRGIFALLEGLNGPNAPSRGGRAFSTDLEDLVGSVSPAFRAPNSSVRRVPRPIETVRGMGTAQNVRDPGARSLDHLGTRRRRLATDDATQAIPQPLHMMAPGVTDKIERIQNSPEARFRNIRKA